MYSLACSGLNSRRKKGEYEGQRSAARSHIVYIGAITYMRYQPALHYTHMHILVSTSLPTLSIVCMHFPSSSYYRYIINVIRVSRVNQ